MGLLLFGVIGLNFWWLRSVAFLMGSEDTALVSHHELAWFSRSLFVSVMSVQAALVLGLAPGMVADAIASERQRKTLHYLLASTLSSSEIVLGKFGARLIDLFVFTLVSLPVISLLTLIGGIDPEELLWFYASLTSSAVFLGATSILVSVESRRPRDAFWMAYVLAILWLILPTLDQVLLLSPRLSSSIGPVFDFVFEWIWPASPFAVLGAIISSAGQGPDPLREQGVWQIASQAVYSLLFSVLAVWRLRPAFRAYEGRVERGRRRSRCERKSRASVAQSCGDDPIYWKETVFARPRGGIIRRLGSLVFFLSIGYVLIHILGSCGDAFYELWFHGYHYIDSQSYAQRAMFSSRLRVGGAALFTLWMIWLVQILAPSLVSEREQDTWISLLATPLEAKDILRGKMLGGLRRTAPLGITLIGLWLVGVLSGAVHPLGFLAAMILVAMYTWFVMVVAMAYSLRASSSWRAQSSTLLMMIAPNFCCLISPSYAVAAALFSYAELPNFIERAQAMIIQKWPLLMISVTFLGIAGYAATAYLLTRYVFGQFDVVVDRPRRAPD